MTGALGTGLQESAGKIRLVALCDNRTGVGSKELCFQQGDILVLERELDSERVICCSESSGSRTWKGPPPKTAHITQALAEETAVWAHSTNLQLTPATHIVIHNSPLLPGPPADAILL